MAQMEKSVLRFTVWNHLATFSFCKSVFPGIKMTHFKKTAKRYKRVGYCGIINIFIDRPSKGNVFNIKT